MKTNLKTAITNILMLSFISFQAQAAPVSINTSTIDSAGVSQGTSLRFGATLSTTSRAYQGIDDQTATLPYLEFEYGKFHVEGLNLGYQLGSSESASWELLAVPRFLGYKESNSPALAGLDETNYSVHAGLSFNGVAGPVNYNAQLLTDVLGESGGTEFIGTVSKAFVQGKFALVPSLSANWQDEQLVDHYYGINSSGATQNRPEYSGDATVNLGLSLLTSYSFNKNIDVIGVLRADRFGEGITNSPIVDTETTSSATLGLTYSF